MNTQARAALPWLGFALLLVLATSPVWRPALLGWSPTLTDFLALRCAP